MPVQSPSLPLVIRPPSTRLKVLPVIPFLALAACGAAGAAAPATTRTVASARAAASTEAGRLLALVHLPSGATPDPAAHATLTAPGGGVPSVSSLVLRTRFVRVPLAVDRLRRWLLAHPPAGLPTSTTTFSEVRRDHPPVTGLAFEATPGPDWNFAQLQIAVTADGPRASLLRADAVVVWLDPRPLTDNRRGPRLRVVAAGTCPANDDGAMGVANPGPDLARELLPPGRPEGGLLCRYRGAGPDGNRLATQRRLDRTAAARVAAAARALPLSHPDGGVSSCPADVGTATVVALRYPQRADIDLWVTDSGCPYVGNGRIVTDTGRLGTVLARS